MTAREEIEQILREGDELLARNRRAAMELGFAKYREITPRQARTIAAVVRRRSFSQGRRIMGRLQALTDKAVYEERFVDAKRYEDLWGAVRDAL